MEVSEKLLKRLQSIPAKRKQPGLVWELFLRPSFQPVLAAASIFLVLLSLYFFNPNKNLINRAIDRQIHVGYSKIGKLYASAESIASSLGGYKEDFSVSLKKINPLKKFKKDIEN